MNWLLLRGLYRQALHWGDFPSVLSELLPGARAMALDLPGFGAAAGSAPRWSVRELTDDVRARWLALSDRGEGPWGLLAISLGAMVAMDWCSRYPRDFSRLVLVNSSARDLGSPGERFNRRFFPEVARILLAPSDLTRERAILQMTSRLEGDALARALERNQRIAREHPLSRAAALAQLAAAARFKSPERISVPTLVVCGRGDRLVNPECSARLARKLGAPLAEHPWAGHDLPLDDPRWLARTVAGWAGC